MTDGNSLGQNIEGIYADRVVVQYRQIDHPGAAPGDSLVLMVSPCGRVDLDELRSEIERISYAVQSDGTTGYSPYLLDQTLRRHSWGADATVIEFLYQAAASGLIGSVTWEGLKAIATRFAAKFRTDSSVPPQPLTEREARFWGPAMTQRRFELTEQPTVTKVQFNSPNATVWMTGTDGSKYVAEIELIAGLAALGSVSREYPCPNP